MRVLSTLLAVPLLLVAAWPFWTDPVPKTASFHPNGQRAFLVALDGVDNAQLDGWMSRGWMPNLRSLAQRSSRCDLRGTLDPDFPAGLLAPVTWNVIETGFDSAYHTAFQRPGIPDPSGYAELPANSTQRLLPTFWEVMSNFEMEVAVVGWWNTWPADWVKGALVSDRFFLDRFDVGPYSSHEVPLSGGDLSPLYTRGVPHLTYPDELADPLAKSLESVVAQPDPVLGRVRKLRDQETDPVLRRHLDGLAAAIEHDLLVITALGDLVGAKRFDLSTCYLSSLLTAMSWFSKYAMPERWLEHPDPRVRAQVSAEDRERFGSVLPDLVGLLDREIGRLYRLVGEDAHLVLLSAYGFDTPEPGAGLRQVDLDPLLEELGLLVRGPDGSVDWSKTRYFDRSLQPFDMIRVVEANYVGDFAQGFVPSANTAQRVAAWVDLDTAVLEGVLVQPPWTHPRTPRDRNRRIYINPPMKLGAVTPGRWAEQFFIYNGYAPGTQMVLPGGRAVDVDRVFPFEDFHARIRESGTLWMVRPEGQKGLGLTRLPPFGEEFGYRTRVVNTLLSLFGLPHPALMSPAKPEILPADIAQEAAIAVVDADDFLGFVGRGDRTKASGERHLFLREEMAKFGYRSNNIGFSAPPPAPVDRGEDEGL